MMLDNGIYRRLAVEFFRSTPETPKVYLRQPCKTLSPLIRGTWLYPTYLFSKTLILYIYFKSCVELCIFMGVRSAIPPSAAQAAGRYEGRGGRGGFESRGPRPSGDRFSGDRFSGGQQKRMGGGPPAETSGPKRGRYDSGQDYKLLWQLPGERSKRTCIMTCLINLSLPLRPHLQELSLRFSGAQVASIPGSPRIWKTWKSQGKSCFRESWGILCSWIKSLGIFLEAI